MDWAFSGGGGILTVPIGQTQTGFRALPLGAGGFITGLSIAPDGTKFIRTDTYGAYVNNGPNGTWKQVLTYYSMPSNDPNVGYLNGGGVQEICVAPSNSSHLYMAYGGEGDLGGSTTYLYRSLNKGVSWTRSFAYGPFAWDANDSASAISSRLMGSFIAVDPINDFCLFMSSPSNGLYYSRDGGATFIQITAVGTATTDSLASQGGGHLIAFDRTSAIVGGFTQGIYVSTYGHGVFHSTDGGTTWTSIPGPPLTHNHLIVDQIGRCWLVVQSRGSGTINTLWSFQSGAWTNRTEILAQQNRIVTIAVNPNNSSIIMAGLDSGSVVGSFNNGLSWNSDISFSDQQLLGYNDVTWIPYCDQTNPFPNGASFLGNANQVYDPSTGFLYFAAGRGVWFSRAPGTLAPPVTPFGSATTWILQSAGIEQLVARDITIPPGGRPCLAVGDKAEFTLVNTAIYPDHNGPLGGAGGQNINVLGHSIDYASSNTSTIVVLCNLVGEFSSVSQNGGLTFTKFANTNLVPSDTGLGGCIAASSTNNYVWIGSNNNPYIYTTTDGGSTWNQILLPGIPVGGTSGWGSPFFLNRKIVAADRVNANTFYAYNVGDGSVPAWAGIYKSTDSGITWTKVFSGIITGGLTGIDAFNGHLRTVPGHAGHLFWSTGGVGSSRTVHPSTSAPFMRSTDGGATWNAVSNVFEVLDYALGATPPGGSYPAVFIAGFVGVTYGIWRSDDNCVTWNYMTQFPLGSFDTVVCMGASLDVYNQVYMGFLGSGYMWSTP